MLTKKASQTLDNAADAAPFYPPLGLAAPRDLSQRAKLDRLTPPSGLAPAAGLASSNRSKAGNYQQEGISGTDQYTNDSDAEETSAGAGSMSRFVSEGAEPEAEEFHMDATAVCFVPMPRFLSTPICQRPSPTEAMEVAASPVIGWQ